MLDLNFDRCRLPESTAYPTSGSTIQYSFTANDQYRHHVLPNRIAERSHDKTKYSRDRTYGIHLEVERMSPHTSDRYRSLVESNPTGLFLLEGDAVAYHNEAFAALLGTDETNVTGRSPETFIAPPDRARIEATIEAVRDGERTSVRQWPVALTGEDSATVELLARETTVDGEPAVASTVVDLATARAGPDDLLSGFRQLAARSETRNGDVSHSGPTEDRDGTGDGSGDGDGDGTNAGGAGGESDRLGALIAGVAHDIRNPLAIAVGNVDLLEGQLEQPQAAQLARVAEALDRIEEIVKNAMLLAGEGEIDATESVGLERAAREAWESVSAASAALSVTTTRRVWADVPRLKRLFENLFRNAVEHAGPDVAIHVGDLPDGFYVADDGPGIPPEARDRIFEMCYSGAESTGMGLAIVEAIVEGHGWRIDLAEDADGARFEIRGVEGR